MKNFKKLKKDNSEDPKGQESTGWLSYLNAIPFLSHFDIVNSSNYSRLFLREIKSAQVYTLTHIKELLL